MIVLLFLCALGSFIGIVLIVSDRSAGDVAQVYGTVRRPAGPARWHLERLSGGLAALALLWVIGVVLALFFVPMITTESASGSAGSDVVTVTRETRPLIGSSASVKVVAVAVGAVVVAIGWRLGRPPRSALFVIGCVAAAFCVVTGFSIGLFFLPVPLLLLAAGATSPPPPRQMTSWEGQH